MSASTLMAMAAAFNLVCTGTDWKVIGKAPNAKSEFSDFSVIYRIDLESRRWCRDDCAQTRPFFNVGATELIFDYLDGPDDFYSDVSVNRESGSYSATASWTLGTSIKQGTCIKAPFTGFPTRKF